MEDPTTQQVNMPWRKLQSVKIPRKSTFLSGAARKPAPAWNCGPWGIPGKDPHWSSSWRTAVHERDPCRSSFWKTVSHGRDSALKTGKSWGERSIRDMDWPQPPFPIPLRHSAGMRKNWWWSWPWRRGKGRFRFISHYPTLLLIGNKLILPFLNWVNCFACYCNYWVISLSVSWPMCFFHHSFLLILLRKEKETSLVGSWQPAKVKPPHFIIISIMLNISLK